MSTKVTWLRTAVAAAALSVASVSAQAGWIQITDPDLTDTATNPDSPSLSGGTPASQSATDIGAWLQDLLNLSSPPDLLALADEFNAGTISGIADGALYLTLHYGNLAAYELQNA